MGIFSFQRLGLGVRGFGLLKLGPKGAWGHRVVRNSLHPQEHQVGSTWISA